LKDFSEIKSATLHVDFRVKIAFNGR